MPDLIITPGSGLIEFVKEGAQSPTVYRLEMAEGAGLILNAPLTSSVGMKAPNMMDSFGNNIFAGTSTFNGPTIINGNLSVFGTTNLFSASNVYISSSQLTIEDNILTLNAFSPYLRYAGIEMIDSGSGTLSSMLWDGQGDYFFLSGSSVNGKILTGPDGQTDLTSGYIPKATAGYKLGNSLIYDDGSRVGINTTAPSSSLTIQSNGTQLRLQTQSAPGSFFANIGSRYDSTRPFTIEVANNSSTPAEFMGIYADGGGANNRVVFPTGNIGIGTTNPTQKLEVAGYVMAGEGLYRTNIYGSNGGAWIGFGDTGSLNSLGRIGAYGALFNINSLNNDISFQYNSAEKMRVTTGGHLGLGITNPAAYVNANGNWFRPSLDGLYSSIYATTEAVVNLISSGSADGAAVGGVYFTRARAQGDAHYQIAAIKAFQAGTSNTIAGGTLYFYTKNNNGGTAAIDPAMVIGPGGNIGVGTTNPTVKLHISGSSNDGTAQLKIDGIGAPNTFNWASTFINADLSSSRNYISLIGQGLSTRNSGYIGFNHSGTAGSTSNFLTFGLYGVDNILNINGNGRVGIGTTNPTQKLDIVGSYAAAGDSSGILKIRGGSTGNDTQLNFGVSADGGYGWIQATDVGLTNNTNIILNPLAGNIGIGTTSPSTKLHIYENANRVTYISQNDNHIARFEAYGTATAIDTTASNGIFFRINGGDIVKFAADGAVGIGTSTVGAPLHIYRASNPWIRLNGGGSFGYIRFDDGTSNGYLFKNTSSDTTNGALAGAMYTYTDSGKAFQHIHAGSPLFTILSGGNIGIGTTAPAASLHVNSTTAGATLIRADGTNGTLFSVVDDLSDSLMSVNNSAGLPVFEVFADDRIVAGQYGQNDFVIRNNKVGIGTNNPIGELHVTSSTSIPSAVFLGGNVGIGTSSPAARLVVIGETQISSNNAYTTHLNYNDSGVNFITTANGGYTDFRGSSNNITTMRVKGDGTVGIGITSPATALHVVGVISGSSFSGAGTGLTGTAAGLSIGGNAATSTIVNGTNGQLLFKDIRAIAPNNISAGYLQFGFTTWANTLSTTPYADYLHLRSYTDSSGGNDNLVMFRKDAIGMRIWQQSFGSATNYSTYKDVAFTDQIGNGTITIAAGTGVGVGTTNTFTTNQSGATTVTISNTGVTSNVAGTGISVSGATGAVTITNSGVTSAVAGTGVSVSGATGAVTFSIGQAVGTGNTPTFAGATLNGQLNVNHSVSTAIVRLWNAGSTIWSLGVGDTAGSYFNISADFGSILINKTNGNIWISGSGINNTVLHSGTTSAPNLSIGGNAATATNANAISFTEVELNAPVTVSGTWTTGNGSEWGEPKFGTSFNQFRYTDGNGPYVEYNIPANHHSCFISQLQWDTGGYADCHGVQADGDLVFLRRINTRQLVENSNHGNTIQHDGATITFAGSGLQAFTKIRITNRLGRIHMTGIAFTRQIDDGYEGTGMVHPAQISHQGAGSGLDADLLDGYSSATANTANTIVLRDASGNFSAGTITATLNGNVSGTAGSETLATVTGRGGSTGTQILVATAAGQAMFVGRQAGAGYSYGSAGIFTAQSDNPNGTQNAFFQGYISSSATVASGNLTFSIRADGQIYTTMNTATGIANNSFSVGQNIVGSIHIANGGGTSGNNRQAAITFQGDSVNTAQAGIYVSNNTSTGTAMGFATTDNYTTGPQLFMTATNTGVVNFPRARPTYAGNALVDVAGGQTIAGITYFSNGESMNVYGIRGRFTNEYLHLYNKVGVGHPGGWGQGEGSTPSQGLSTYGGITVAYGTNATSIFYGNVGIGTTSVNARVESYYSSNAITFNYLATNLNVNSPIPVYGFDVTSGVESRSIKAGIGYERHLTNGRGTLHFYNDSTDDTQSLAGNRTTAGDIKMSLDNSGNLGIGTTQPSYKLHVRQATPSGQRAAPANTSIQVDSNTNNYLSFVNTADNGTYAGLTFVDNNIGGYIVFRNYTGDVTTGSDSLIYGTFQDHIFQNSSSETINGKTETMRIKQNGNIGMGTNNPSTRTHIYGTLTVDAAGNTANSFTEGIRLGAATNGYSIVTFGVNAAASTGQISNQWWIGKHGSDSSFNFNSQGGGDVFRILQGGNVGIGTTVPGRKLDVEGIVRTRGASGTGGFEIGAASTGAAKWRIEWDSASDSLDFNWVG